MLDNLKGKTCIITGATGGIGESIAQSLLSLGVKCVLSGTNQEKLNALKEKFIQYEQSTFFLRCNLLDEAECRDLVKKSAELLGQVDFLVCNAGITKDNLSIKMTIKEWNDVMNVNLTSSFILSQEAIKLMMRKRFGRIIYISSVVGLSGNPGQANYVSSKAGLIGLSKSLAREVASRSININTIAPGFIETEMTAKLPEQVVSEITKTIPLSKYGKPQDIANTVLFLLSSGGDYITGETINVNGGMYMQ